MSKYYCLIAGLPTIALDDTRAGCTVAEFQAEIEPELSKRDMSLMQRLYLKYDNANLLSYLRSTSGEHWDERGIFSRDDMRDIVESLKNEDRLPEKKAIPPYFAHFIRDYLTSFNTNEPDMHILPDDKLATLYYNDALACENTFLIAWFELNLNIGNIMTALNCRKHGLEKERYIVGNNDIAEQLRRSDARDFHLGTTLAYLPELMQITEEPELLTREKRLDALRWRWLDDNTFFKTFDIESVIAYLLRLDMIERWRKLDSNKGETTFRRLIADMKRESADSLEKFKENHK